MGWGSKPGSGSPVFASVIRSNALGLRLPLTPFVHGREEDLIRRPEGFRATRATRDLLEPLRVRRGCRNMRGLETELSDLPAILRPNCRPSEVCARIAAQAKEEPYSMKESMKKFASDSSVRTPDSCACHQLHPYARRFRSACHQLRPYPRRLRRTCGPAMMC